jgi:hypothetical protein
MASILSGDIINYQVKISRLPIHSGDTVVMAIDIDTYGVITGEPITPVTVSTNVLTWTYGGTDIQSFSLTADTNDAIGNRTWTIYFDISSTPQSVNYM